MGEEQDHCSTLNNCNFIHRPKDVTLALRTKINCDEKTTPLHETYSTDLVNKTHQQPPSMTLNDSAISHSTCYSNTSFKYSKKGTHISNLNICHLMPKLDEIKLMLSNVNSPDILGLCETFLHENIDDNCLKINYFTFERKDRVGKKKGGGIIVYMSNKLSYKRCLEYENDDIESVRIQINSTNSKAFLLNFVYRPPNAGQTWIDLYEAQLDRVDLSRSEYYILGDFNINYLSANTDKHFNNTKWVDLVSKFDFVQLVESSTRVTKYSEKIIDHIYTPSCYVTNINEVFVSPLSLSDHYPISFTHTSTMSLSKSLHKYMQYRSFKQFDISVFKERILQLSIHTVEILSDPNEALNLLYHILNTVLSDIAPVKTKRIKYDTQPGWFCDEIKSMIFQRNKFHQDGNFEQYKILRNKVTATIKRHKRNFFNKAIQENKDVKYLWKNLKYISNLNQSRTVQLPRTLKKNSEILTTDLRIINELNTYFVNISSLVKLTDFSPNTFVKLQKKLDEKLANNIFEIPFISTHEVKLIINKLNINKSTGIDGISPKIIKYCGDTVISSITSIINNSIASGTFPDKLKQAKVIPLFKSGTREDPANYRPISILPTLSKIFERHIANHMHEYFKKTDIIHKYQSGFRKDHSCVTALTRLIDSWMKDIDEEKTHRQCVPGPP